MAMTETITILGIAGSLRRDSYNRAALRAAQALAPAEATMDIFDLQGIPLWGPWARRVPSITCGKSLSF